MASIKPIEGRSIHQIQSGQVIIDLCSVVKELVENSLDAGATSIDVRFKDNGLESIEVQDNGAGISPDDYETIALKHYTSKLSSYDDLGSLNTFGFRGEALSSLCALSKFYIVTARPDEAPKGKRLDFEVSGKLKATSIAACQKGTTNAVEDLFYNLPVRRRELEKNVKREYKKVLDILQAYACISTGVRISVTHQPTKGKKTTVFSTKASQGTKENIANIYGAKTLSALVALDLELQLQPTASQRMKNQADGDSSTRVRIVGHVSKPVFGEGRSTPDRQMFFVNNRPCLLPQIAKAFNEVYKSYNITQSPFVFANLMMDTHAYDVNVSPDKRTILLHDQNALLEVLKQSLVNLFEAQEQTVPQSQLQTAKLPTFRPLTVSKEAGKVSRDESMQPAAKAGVHIDYAPPSTVDPSIHTQSTGTTTTNTQDPDSTGLLSKFVGRNLHDREDATLKPIAQADQPISKEKQRLVRQIQGQRNHFGEDTARDFAPQITQMPPPPEAGRAVQDFNARILSQQQKSARRPSLGLDNHRQDGLRPETEVAIDVNKPQCDHSPADSVLAREVGQDVPGVKGGVVNGTTALLPQRKKRKASPSALSARRPAAKQASHFPQHLHTFAAPGSQLSISSQRMESAESSASTTERSASSGASSASRGCSRAGSEADQPEDTGEAFDLGLSRKPSASAIVPDQDLIDEEERRRRDEAQVQEMVLRAEQAAARSSQEQQKRAAGMMKSPTRKDSTLALVQILETTASRVETQLTSLTQAMEAYRSRHSALPATVPNTSSKASAEERLSLTIAKSDFGQMQIVGQFNLGFILATRAANVSASSAKQSDELFIIDQHASDEIYNFSRLSLSTTLTPQPLVRPHQLELTAIEEETILSHTDTLTKNGFTIHFDDTGDLPVGQRCHLMTLPTSRETVFDTRDLEELIALLSEATPSVSEITRPSKVRKMLAMRACRSSIMVGRTLTQKSMEGVVRHMGEIDKPWNCPHGRPTMRHLASLGQWGGWEEGDGLVDDDGDDHFDTSWSSFLQRSRGGKDTNVGGSQSGVDPDSPYDEDEQIDGDVGEEDGHGQDDHAGDDYEDDDQDQDAIVGEDYEYQE